MMRRFSQGRDFMVAALIVAALVQCTSASAWGPKTRQAIALAAANLVRQSFTTGEIVYEADLLRGAADGVGALGGQFPLNNDEQAVDAVALEIIVIREAIRNGAVSYAAYRMGGLAALVSELMVPYGLIYDESERELADRIRDDLEARADKFAVSPPKPTFEYLMNHRLYFQDKRTFYEADKILITDDYTRGPGPRGMLAQSGKKYFERSIDAVTDVWYTILHIESGSRDFRPSNRQMAFYYVAEVKYLLAVKRNMEFAERSYELFQKYDPGLPMALVELGDAYYNFGNEAGKQRGVREWEKAYAIPGPAREEASRKLAKHYIEEGENLYRRAQTPEGKDTDLPYALDAFTKALSYDLANSIAANRVTDTTKAINKRKEDFELQQRFLENASAMTKKAERHALEKDFNNALTSYSSALMVIGQVTPQFKDLAAKARDESSKINQAVKQVISSVYAAANEAIEKGDAALINGNVDEAVRFYSSVESIVGVIPAEEGSVNAQKKQDMVAAAQTKIDEAEIQRKRLEQQKQPAVPALKKT